MRAPKCNHIISNNTLFFAILIIRPLNCMQPCYFDIWPLAILIDLWTARPKWRPDGPALSGHLLYSLVNPAYSNRYHHHLVR